MSRPRIFPPVYLLAAVLLMVGLHFLFPIRQLIGWPWRWIGVLIAAGGVGLGGSVAALFARRKTTLAPGEVSSALVTTRPFRVSRNPIYLGMVILLIGAAVFLGSASPLLVIPVFFWVIQRNIIPVEEAMLREAFGETYVTYCKSVRRWV